MDYLVLNFNNALWFPHSAYSKDKIKNFHTGEIIQRKEQRMFAAPITVHQISNVLHVLVGDRPVSFFRKSVYGRNEEIFELAKKSYLYLKPYQFVDKYGNIKNIEETLSTTKGVHNSWRKSYTFTWSLIERRFGYENFQWFIKELEENIGFNPLSISINEVLPFVNKEKFRKNFYYEKVIKKDKEGNDKDGYTSHGEFVKMGLSSLGWLMISHEDEHAQRSAVNLALSKNPTSLMVLSGIEKVVSLSGKIYVPLPDDIRQKIEDNKGVASLLDSGVVWIDSVQSESDMEWDGFVNVGEISTDFVKLKEKK